MRLISFNKIRPLSNDEGDARMSVTAVQHDYFMQIGDEIFAGLHYVLDIFDANRLDDVAWVLSAMRGAAQAANASILHDYMHPFGPEQGVSGVLVLAESHISVHTWPERAYAAFDVFMCGNTQPQKAISFLKACWPNAQYSVNCFKRGVALHDNLD